jgi:hypothetical protein
MKTLIIKTALLMCISITLVAYPVSAQFNGNFNSGFSEPEKSQEPIVGGVRVILPEEEIDQTSEQVSETKSQRTVLYGLAAMFLVVVAVVVALSLNPFGRNPRLNNSTTEDDNQKL